VWNMTHHTSRQLTDIKPPVGCYILMLKQHGKLLDWRQDHEKQ
jgi:hypothetical protein